MSIFGSEFLPVYVGFYGVIRIFCSCYWNIFTQLYTTRWLLFSVWVFVIPCGHSVLVPAPSLTKNMQQIPEASGWVYRKHKHNTTIADTKRKSEAVLV